MSATTTTTTRAEEIAALRLTVASLTRQRDYYQAEALRFADEAAVLRAELERALHGGAR